MTIHWCGTGLSAIPGLRRLIEAGHEVTVWNRTEAKARDAVGDLTDNIHAFDIDALGAVLARGDVIVSMLPGDWHVPLAELAIAKGANFVSSSYIAPEMRALDPAARDAGVALVNEVGLDPGIDHLMAHALVADYRASPAFDAANHLSFSSYCGGIPKQPNAFRYKFSWSPLGVLKALRSPQPLDPRLFRAARRPALGRDHLLCRAAAGARELRGLSQPRFAALHGAVRVRGHLAGARLRARHHSPERLGRGMGRRVPRGRDSDRPRGRRKAQGNVGPGSGPRTPMTRASPTGWCSAST